MSPTPQLSVVMSVYNGAERLSGSLKSVLAQEGVDLELIVVDDGSTDATPDLLREFAASDSRVKVIHQANAGLTLALIRGCAQARGRHIARQDCGDVSLPGRLASQVQVLESNPTAALVSCGARFIGPEGDFLYDVVPGEFDPTAGLLSLDFQTLRGPAHHGSTMFPRDAYERAGGYREQFYFAQDLDLWTRLAERGTHVAMDKVLYQAVLEVGSISSLHRKSQIEYARLIQQCMRLRRLGESEAPVLARAAASRPDPHAHSPADLADALYFIGVCLQNRQAARARKYFLAALRANPFHLKSAARLVMGSLR